MELILFIGGLSAMGAFAALGVAFHHTVCMHRRNHLFADAGNKVSAAGQATEAPRQATGGMERSDISPVARNR